MFAWLYFRLTNPSEIEDSNGTGNRHKSIDVLLSRMSFPMSQENPFGNATRLLSMICMEFVGSFMITWCTALSINADPSDQAIVVGAAVTGMVYSGGAVSGAHYNPAVTLGVNHTLQPITGSDYDAFIAAGIFARNFRESTGDESCRCITLLFYSGILIKTLS